MANFYGTVSGARGDASRLGNKVSGMTTQAAGWQGCIRTELTHRDGKDYFKVTLTPWHGSGGATRTLAEGVLNASLNPLVSIHVNGRRWFRKSAGNTYSSAKIYANFADGETREFSMPKQNGYGDYYMQVSADILEGAELMSDREHYSNGGAESLSYYCRRNGIDLTYSCADVARERDL